ncbi:MAG: hypothetical protein EZS28_038553, partial [Streblomastix strix]
RVGTPKVWRSKSTKFGVGLRHTAPLGKTLLKSILTQTARLLNECYSRINKTFLPCSELHIILSRFAAQRQIATVFHVGDEDEENGDIYSAQVMFDQDGKLIGSNHKHNLYGHESQIFEKCPEQIHQLDKPIVDWSPKMKINQLKQNSTDFHFITNSLDKLRMNTIRISLITCFDLMFPSQFRQIRDNNITHIALSSSWYNQGFVPIAHATSFFAGASFSTQTKVIASNEGKDWIERGGGIFDEGLDTDDQ